MNHILPLYATQYNWTSRFLGLPMEQNRNSIPLLSELLEFTRPDRIIELGSGRGGMSVLLALYAYVTGGKFFTYDLNVPEYADTIKMFGGQCITKDFLQEENKSEIIKSLREIRIRNMVICDASDHVKELNAFKNSLKTKDTILIHDYSDDKKVWHLSQIKDTDFNDTSFERLFKDEMKESAWMAWRKK